jgi:hypothetical protein
MEAHQAYLAGHMIDDPEDRPSCLAASCCAPPQSRP